MEPVLIRPVGFEKFEEETLEYKPFFFPPGRSSESLEYDSAGDMQAFLQGLGDEGKCCEEFIINVSLIN